MMLQQARGRMGGEAGYTLIELLVVMILVGILAAIALAVFLNQEDKGKDVDAKSDVNNLVHLVQACNAARDAVDDFRGCDTEGEIGENSLPFDPTPPAPAPPAGCPDTNPGAVISGTVRVAMAGKDCFVVVGESKSGNRFWYVKHDDGSAKRDCTTRGVNGCPVDGDWAG